ncbi:hypothetical protein L1987_78127 [Smallanthus sonchifolius]|uniref:Uncharacterized protein n=1 Tax=Smallanthus sonchifolius TaxID=185202 RepID=A0ACB8ZCV3_9ASTR|nr:hypothetical protein L1987_78127 [Smallanthus sonchifolius]
MNFIFPLDAFASRCNRYCVKEEVVLSHAHALSLIVAGEDIICNSCKVGSYWKKSKNATFISRTEAGKISKEILKAEKHIIIKL